MTIFKGQDIGRSVVGVIFCRNYYMLKTPVHPKYITNGLNEQQ